jgi:hypothetical protein
MTAVAAPPSPPVVESRGAPALRVYRDDGPLALALGTTLGRALAVPPAALLVAAALPAAAVIAVDGADAPAGLVAAAVAWIVLLGGASGGRPHEAGTSWLAPPLLRAIEYATIIWLAALAGAREEGAAFALLAALAFRHYDLTYRLRHRGAIPPAWLNRLAGGWEGRLIAVWALGLAGALPAALYVLAAGFAVLFVTECVHSWTHLGRAPRPMLYDDEEDEGL